MLHNESKIDNLIPDTYLKKLKCNECGKSYETIIKLRVHVKTNHKSQNGICCDCNKSFKSKDYLRSHITNIHETKENPKCNICQKVFAGRKYLTTHLKTLHSSHHVRYHSNHSSNHASKEKAIENQRNRIIVHQHEISPELSTKDRKRNS